MMGSKDRGGSYPSTSSTVVRLYTSSQSMLFQTHPRRSCTVQYMTENGPALHYGRTVNGRKLPSRLRASRTLAFILSYRGLSGPFPQRYILIGDEFNLLTKTDCVLAIITLVFLQSRPRIFRPSFDSVLHCSKTGNI